MRLSRSEKTKDPVNNLFLFLGITLIGFGAILLIYLGFLVFNTIYAPQDVRIVGFVLEHVRAGDTAIYGQMTDELSGRKMDFVLNWSESVRLISFMFLGVAVMGVMAGILKVLIEAGIKLVRLSAAHETKGKST
jgi:hypothetical protein